MAAAVVAALTLVAGWTWALPTSAAPAAVPPAGSTFFPDLQTIIPTNAFSIVQTPTGREFRYTHLAYDAGPGPLEIQPQYNEASGNYQGVQQLFTRNTNGSWSMTGTRRVPDAFIFHAAHGHFHFPLAAFGLYSVAPGGGVGAPAALSPKIGFCISDSYIYDQSVPNAGAFVGTQGSCADPTTLRGMSVGGADEYDYRDPGQAVPIDGLPDGTYWFRARTDPNNDFVEADETNNETDVLVTISNGTVVPGQVTHPDTTPPAVTLTAPADGASVTGTVALTATSPVSGAGAVQFVVDGVPVGTATQATSPYTFNWDTTAMSDGVHWVAARVTDGLGRVSTSAVSALTVTNVVGSPTGPLTIDAKVSVNGRSAVTTPGLTTTKTGDVLLAFVGADGPLGSTQTSTVTGGGLTWSLVRRANTSPGTSEVWKAQAGAPTTGLKVTSTAASAGFDQSLTVVAFSGSSGVGASSSGGALTGAPSTTVTTTKAGSWVFGVGNDWSSATARTLGGTQTMQSQWVDTAVGDTFWVQSKPAPTPATGTAVQINDVAPSDDFWNLAAVEVLANSTGGSDTTKPQVAISDPPAGATLTGTVALGATATDNVGVTSVQFKVDGQPVGAPVTAPPFMLQWDSRTVTAGSHTLSADAADAAGNVGTSAGVVVTVNNSAPPPAVVAVDGQVNTKATGTLKSPALTTPTSGDLVVAFVSIDGPNGAAGQRSTVTGAGLTWTLVKRSDSQAGVSEIWVASRPPGTLTGAVVTATPQKGGFDGMLTVMAFKNAAGVGVAGASGAPSGAPDIYLPGIAAGSWVFAGGNDWDGAVARTPIAGQTLRQQWVDTRVGDTFWLQSTAAPSTSMGLVTIHDNAPVNHQWNYVAVEIVAAPASAGLALTGAARTTGATTSVASSAVTYCLLAPNHR